ncbi:SPOR domain-containing protein [Roseivivax sp. CAU 1761]
MAETYQAGPVTGVAPGHGLAQGMIDGIARWTKRSGAVMSLALMLGIGVWGTQQVLRDVSGVPVVLATEGPMRLAPEDPGGRFADHLGLAVNAVAGLGLAEGSAETLRLAPEMAGLSDEDLAQAAFAAAEAEETAADAPGPAPLPSLSELTASAYPDPTGRDLAAAAPKPPREDEATAASIDSVLAEVLGVAQPVLAAAIVPASVPGVAVSLRPSIRPAGVYRAVALAPERARPAEPAAVKEIASETLSAGTRLVQLGAFDSPETARREWQRLSGRFEAFMANKVRVIEQASSGGKTFYRLRAHGFDDLSDARRFCAAFVAEKADCIPVVTR